MNDFWELFVYGYACFMAGFFLAWLGRQRTINGLKEKISWQRQELDDEYRS